MWLVERAAGGLALTVVAYSVAVWLRRRTRLTLMHPAVTATVLVLAALAVLRLPLAQYETGGRLLSLLIGPATVAMAVPVYRHRALLRSHWPALLAGILTGCLVGVGSSVTMALVMGLGRITVLSTAAKSVTTPVAMAISRRLGGIPSLTVALVLVTAVSGALLGPWMLDLLRVRNRLARGLALGAAAQAVGTERALQIGELEGAASTLSMAFSAIFATVLVPPSAHLILRLMRLSG